MRPRTYKPDTLLKVYWLDIEDDSSWLTPTKAKSMGACECESVGFFLSKDKTVIRISPSYQPKEKDRSITIIPWGCITKIEKK